MEPMNIAEKFARFSEHWQPKIVAELNGQEVKLVKVKGTFPWHHHDDVEEMFLVWRGRFRAEFRDRIVELGPGELVVVPRGVEHRTAADEEAEGDRVGAGGCAEYRERHRRKVHGLYGREDLRSVVPGCRPPRPRHFSRGPGPRRRRRRARANPLPRIFAAQIRHPHTRRTYARAAEKFLAWCTDAGLRYRAPIGLMVYSFARIGAALGMMVEDVYTQNRRLWGAAAQEGGKRHAMPCHHNLEEYPSTADLDGAGIRNDPKGATVPYDRARHRPAHPHVYRRRMPTR
jgi:mannose-6-phosphate isomerase-like protein (cupin superfamily)